MSHKPQNTCRLIDHMRKVADPRINRTRLHKMEDILVIGVCTLLCGGETFCDMENFGRHKQEWLQTFLELPNGIPSHDTFNRVFSAIDSTAFSEQFMKWTESIRAEIKAEIVAIDGKALRRAKNAGEEAQYVVSAWANENRLVLGQLEVPAKTNEITVVPDLLKALNVAGCIVTTDAMGCQKNIAEEIRNQGAHYVLALKANHCKLFKEVEEHFRGICGVKDGRRIRSMIKEKKRVNSSTCASHYCSNNGHGRLEARAYFQSSDLSSISEACHWEGLKTVAMAERVRIVEGVRVVDRHYYISSLPKTRIRAFAKAVRSHWGVENSCHWVLDVCFREDDNRARTGHAAANLATLRRLALNLLRRDTSKRRGIRGKQLDAGWDNSYLMQILRNLDA